MFMIKTQKENKPIISIDYDGTYTLNPSAMDDAIRVLLDNGFEVICCTMRYKEDGEELMDSIGKLCDVYFTGRKSKYHYLLKEYSLTPNIWMDDMPYWVHFNAADYTRYDRHPLTRGLVKKGEGI